MSRILMVHPDGSIRESQSGIPDGRTAKLVIWTRGYQPPFNEWGTIPADQVDQAYRDMMARRRQLFVFTGRELDGLPLYARAWECPICGGEIAWISDEVDGKRQYGCCCCVNLERLMWPRPLA
jgi:hypothetical protein